MSRQTVALLSALALFFGLQACSPESETGRGSERSSEVVRTSSTSPAYTPLEIQALDTIRARGVLRVALTPSPDSYRWLDDGVEGFPHALARAFAASVGVEAEFGLVSVCQEIYALYRDADTLEGTESPGYRFDFCIPDLTVSVVRRHSPRLVPTIPASLLVVTRVGEEMHQLGDLQGTTAVVLTGSEDECRLRSVVQRLGLDVEVNTVVAEESPYEQLREGRADFTLCHSDELLVELEHDNELNASLALDEPAMRAWVSLSADDALAAAARRFVEWTRATGRLSSLMTEYYGVGLEEYERLLRYDPDQRLELDSQELTCLDDVRARGGFRVATYDGPPMYLRSSTGEIRGLHFNLCLAVADLLESPVSFETVRFLDFFSIDGQIPQQVLVDPSFTYTPDLLSRSDFYAATFTPLPWRQQFLSFISIYPSRLVYVAREGTPVESVAPAGSRLSLLQDSSYTMWIAENLATDQLEIVSVPDGTDAVRMVSTGQADFTLADASLALTYLRQFDNLTMIPTSADLEYLSWAVAKDNSVLASLLEKTIDHLKETLVFDAIWREYYGGSFNAYLELLVVE
jgi:ABC-type amino acid transport substrate-binding protein